MADMTGRKDLGVYRAAQNAIPKQSKAMTRVGDSATHNKAGGKKDIQGKLKKVMKAQGMLDNC